MKLSLLLSFSTLALPALGQQARPNHPLQHELDSIRTVDQKYRFLLAATRHPHQADSLEQVLHLPKGQLFTYARSQMQRVDSSNLRRLEVILQRYGYPGKSLVGTPANETAWYVIQHSPKISQYLPLVKGAADKGELPYWMYAQMLDRQLMQEGKGQLYGTQAMSYRVRNKQSGQPEQVRFLWPVADTARANERRRQAGLSGTLAESARSLTGAYQPVTLEYAKQMQQASAELAKQEQAKKL